MKEVSDEVWEIAQDLYEDADFNINRYGELESFVVTDYEDYNGYYRDCTEADFEKAKKYLEELLDGVKYYEGKLVLSDNETANDIDYQAMTPPKPNEVDDFWVVYEMIYSQALENFEQETGVEIYGLGRSGKHICVDDTFVNLTHLEELKNLQQKWEEWLKDEVVKHYTDTGEEVTESLNKGEKQARCLSCGADVIYTNRDVEHDIDGDYIEPPNCHATFDVDYDAIEPLLNKKTESKEQWYGYNLIGEYTDKDGVKHTDEISHAFNTEYLKHYAKEHKKELTKYDDMYIKDTDVNEITTTDGIINKDKRIPITEAEDMSKVKDGVKNAVDKSNSTDLEKDQVKGSIDVLKTDEESAIAGYDEFTKETAKVVDKELSDEIDNQMQEIVDDEKEHIEKLDTIKSALGESKKTEAKPEEADTDKALVYQITDVEHCDYAFMDYDFAKKKWTNLEDYKKVAEIDIENIKDEDLDYILEDIFAYGNMKDTYYKNNPEARSISVSDIIELKGNKYYVNITGFTKLDNDIKTEGKKEVVDKEVQDFVQQCEESGKFNDDQMEVIEYGLKDNLTLEQIKLYAKPELSYGMMFEIEAGFSSDLTMEQVEFYAKPEVFDDNQMRIIRYGFENGLTMEQIEFYAKPELDYHIMAEIEDGFSQGLTMEQVEFYAKPEVFDDNQMEQIRWGFRDGLTLEQIKLYAKPEFNADQMGQIKGGFDDGLTLEQVEQYAKPELTEFDMVQIRYKLKNGLMTEAVDLSYIDSDTNNCKVYYAVNTSGYKSLGLIVNDKDKKFQVVLGQKLRSGSKTAKKSKKQIWDMAKELKANGYEEVRGPSSVAGTVEESKELKTEDYEVWQKYYEDGKTTTEYVQSFDSYEKAQRFVDGLNQDPNCEAWVKDKKEELFNSDVNINVDAGDIASGNNLDLGGLGELVGLMASEETKESEDKLDESKTRFNRAELTAVKDSIDTALNDLQIQSDGTTGSMEDKVLLNDLRDVSQSVGSYLSRVGESKNMKTEANEGTATIDLHTDLVPIINMYQYDIYNMLNDYVGVTEKKLDEMMLDFAKPLIEEQIKDVLPSAQITFGEFTQSKYYRLFSNLNDILDFNVTYNVAEYEALKQKAVQDPDFEQYLQDHYTSYDGFMSFFADNIRDFEEQEGWKQFVSVLSYYLPNNEEENYDEMCNYVYESTSSYDIMPRDSEVDYVVGEINDKVSNGEIELNKENIISITKDLMSYLDEDDQEIIINDVLEAFNLDENKKEELFDNTADININANDIASNNNVDLGGLGDLLGMTEAKAIEMKKTENKEGVND